MCISLDCLNQSITISDAQKLLALFTFDLSRDGKPNNPTEYSTVNRSGDLVLHVSYSEQTARAMTYIAILQYSSNIWIDRMYKVSLDYIVNQ